MLFKTLRPVTLPSSFPRFFSSLGCIAVAFEVGLAVFMRSSLAMVGVVGLSNRIGPPAIIWSVSHSVIDAVKRCGWRPFAHIGKKAIEGVNPPLTDGDTPTTIPGVVRGIGVETSIFHGRPAFVSSGNNRSSCFTGSMAVFDNSSHPLIIHRNMENAI